MSGCVLNHDGYMDKLESIFDGESEGDPRNIACKSSTSWVVSPAKE